MTTKKASIDPMNGRSGNCGKLATTKDWLASHLRIPTSKPAKINECKLELPAAALRPNTAPSTGIPRKPVTICTAVEPPLVRPLNKPPPRPPRPDSGVIRDVNAWLDMSTVKPAAPLMGGIPYWHESSGTAGMASSDVRYAIPIVKEPEVERPATSHSQHIASFCRKAKKIQVRMPSLLRTKPNRVTVAQQKQADRRSTTMPILSRPLQHLPLDIAEIIAPRDLHRSRSLMHLTPHSQATSISSAAWLGIGQREYVTVSGRCGTQSETTLGETAIRRSPAGLGVPREDSMGNLSDAPTYFTGPPPPSYRSRAASILSTSSFGCVDGMNLEHRQISKHRAAQRNRGMKCRFKRMAQRAHLAK